MSGIHCTRTGSDPGGCPAGLWRTFTRISPARLANLAPVGDAQRVLAGFLQLIRRAVRRAFAIAVVIVMPAFAGSAAVAQSAAASGTSAAEPAPSPAAPAIFEAGRLVAIALASGAALSALLLWRLWRKPRSRSDGIQRGIMQRIDAAASGLPSQREILEWSQRKLTAVVAAIIEHDSRSVELKGEGDVHIEIRDDGDAKPSVVVCCVPGDAGAVSMRRIREIIEAFAATGADQRWIVSPAGFEDDAHAHGEAHGIAPVGCDGLQAMMRDIPPLSLPGVLARE